MNTTPHAAPLFLGLVTLLSCSEDRSGTKTERPEAEIDAGRQADRATADPTPDAAPPVVVQSTLSRAPGRMTVDQLRRSIEIITGGLVWEEDFGDGPTDMLEVLAPTIGAPDYLLVTEENLEPSLIIAKFLHDASHRLCVRWVENESAAPPERRTLVRHAAAFESREEADIKAGLRALQLRFFARYLPEDGAEDGPISALYGLFLNASSTSAPGREAKDGWLAVCIAHMTDPELLLY